MEVNRSFICAYCKKSFTLKWNLKAHAKRCTGLENENSVNCEKCDGRFSSKRTLKVHVLTCFPGKLYHCKECNEKFNIYKLLHEHRQKRHTSLKCDYCDVVVGNSKNMKRHILTKHRGIRPSKAAELERRGNCKSTEGQKKSLKCEDCGKVLFDKSTLNRHMKLHNISCKLCTKMFSTKRDLKNHMRIHLDIKRHADVEVNVVNHKANKKVSWAAELEIVKTIPTTKLPFTDIIKRKILEMFDCLENFMSLCGNRGKSVKMTDFISMYEEGSHKSFDELVFRSLISIYQDAYKIELNKKNLFVTFVGGSKPHDIKLRKTVIDNKILECDAENARYIDLAEFEEITEEKYRSAKQTIAENIIKFDDYDISPDEEELKEKYSVNKFKKLKNKINRRNSIKKKRESQFKKVDWQLKRMSRLANLVNKIFLSESKTSLKLEFLIEKLKYCEYPCSSIDSDLERIIKCSNGWLKPWRGWVRKNSSIHVNDVINLFSFYDKSIAD